ncbi:phospho-N-acetylmuramoyl-pentapeptide-transferase [Candidatus Saccharibacteria bacterium]|nr:MAG: phospho-N-acetylmuramoyl-pentapeptide-transferase [Candidatus Saccharibacteria bacterium]
MLFIDLITNKVTTITLLSVLAFCVAMLLTPIYTHFAYKHKLWKRDRTHSTTGETLSVISKLNIKRDVPLMAGLITIAAVTIVTVAFNLNRNQTWLPLAALLGGGLVGLIDDVINLRGGGGNVAGLRAPLKFGMITLVAAIAAWFFYYKLGFTAIHVPGVGSLHIGWLLIPIFMLVVVSAGNAVNISDGMDGLAGGLLTSAYGAFGVIALFQGNFGISAFCFTVVGALLAYLWFNIPPARFFMGDVGSFALGTSLGVVAMLTDTLLLLPVIGLIFVIEAGSSLAQIFSKRVFHRKIFIAAPIHHHFEASGWPKTKVTMRFWVIGQICAFIGVVLAFAGGFVR